MEKQLAAAYAAYTGEHGREPVYLKTNQLHYHEIEQYCHTDYATGTDTRYQSALLMVADVDGWLFE